MNAVGDQPEPEPGKPELACSNYVLPAPRQQVWDLLAATIIQCMPVEQMEIVDDSTFNAVLKINIGPFKVPFNLVVCAAKIDPIASLGTRVTVSKGPFQASLKVWYLLSQVDENHTSVASSAFVEGSSALMLLLRPQQRKFARQMFDAVQADLERNCS